jgi:hypothetical protein
VHLAADECVRRRVARRFLALISMSGLWATILGSAWWAAYGAAGTYSCRVSVVDPVSHVSSRPRRLRFGVALLVVGCGMLLVAGVMIALAVVPGFAQSMTSTPYALPMDTTISFKAGSWMVFDQTGTSQENGQITSPRLRLDQVIITDSTGASVATYETEGVQTITLNGETYTGVAAFDTPTTGTYRAQVSGDAGGWVVIAPNIEGLFVAAGMWFVMLVAGLPVVGIGLGLALSGRARQRGPSPVLAPSRPSSMTPPGWYPDQTEPGRMLWWDGAQWHRPNPDVSSGPHRGQGLQ